jgi:hypothetical protein
LPAARLACVKHAASVRSEPGSNSQVHQQNQAEARSRRCLIDQAPLTTLDTALAIRSLSLQPDPDHRIGRAGHDHGVRLLPKDRCNCQRSMPRYPARHAAARRQADTGTPHITAGQQPHTEGMKPNPTTICSFLPCLARDARASRPGGRRWTTSLRGAAYDALKPPRQHPFRRKMRPGCSSHNQATEVWGRSSAEQLSKPAAPPVASDWDQPGCTRGNVLGYALRRLEVQPASQPARKISGSRATLRFRNRLRCGCRQAKKKAAPEGAAEFREETSKKDSRRRTALLRCTI